MFGLYTHIPFCASKCGYCDFYSVASAARVCDFVDAVCREISLRADLSTGVSTIYFGGGTPSVLSAAQLAQILAAQRSAFDCSDVTEITLEANPEQLTAQFLSNIRAAGFNRLSIGIQSFVDQHLGLMGRRHTAAQAIAAVRAAQNAGFTNISIDLIYGLPFMSEQQWQSNIEQALQLGVQHISAYHLTIEPRTAFARQGLVAVSDITSERHYTMLKQALAKGGFEHYEISNFALAGFRSKHNSSYWNSTPYFGFGPSAHSYNGGRVRRWNVASLPKYLSLDSYFESEILTDADIHNEFIMTRLRTADGFSASDYFSKFGRRIEPVPLLVFDGDRIYITPEKWLVSDSIIASLFS